MNKKNYRLTDRDLDFLVETAAPETSAKYRLKQILQEDDDFRLSFLTDEKVLRKVLEEESFLKISPRLFFEILLRKTARDLEGVAYTIEKTLTMKIPVFDTKEVAQLVTQGPILFYLADMLSSFTRIESFTLVIRVRKGIWKKIRYNDLDILSLMRLTEAAEEEQRFALYKRIADICLFLLGIFPDYTERDYRYPSSGQVRPHIRGRLRISPDEYAEEGKKFYRLAAEHPSARELDLEEAFQTLHREFLKAKKLLNFIADQYLPYHREKFFI